MNKDLSMITLYEQPFDQFENMHVRNKLFETKRIQAQPYLWKHVRPMTKAKQNISGHYFKNTAVVTVSQRSSQTLRAVFT